VVRPSAGANNYSSSVCVQTSSEAHPASYPKGTGGPFRGKVRPGRDGNHLSPSSAEVDNEELNLLYPLAPEWRSGTGLLFNAIK
jgi:hypothetical protein